MEKCTRSCVPSMVGRTIERKLCSDPPESSELARAFSGGAPHAATQIEGVLAGVAAEEGTVLDEQPLKASRGQRASSTRSRLVRQKRKHIKSADV